VEKLACQAEVVMEAKAGIVVFSELQEMVEMVEMVAIEHMVGSVAEYQL
jgi:hypothetical protein